MFVWQVADCALSSLRVHEGGKLLGVGCADGTVSVLRLGSGLVDVQTGEKAATLAVSHPRPHCPLPSCHPPL